MNKGRNIFRLLGAGVICGLVSGLFGAGGGVIAVLAYQRLGMDTKDAHAAAVATILPVAALTAAVYILRGQQDTRLSLQTAAGALAGGLLASRALEKVRARVLTAALGVLMILTGGWMLFWHS